MSKWLPIAALFIATVWPLNVSAVEPPLEPNKPIGERIWDGFYTAEVHARYHLDMAAYYAKLDFRSRLAMAAVTIIVFGSGAYAATIRLSKRTKIWMLIIEGTLVVASIVVMLSDLSGQANIHATLAHRWETLAKDWDQARLARAHSTEEQLTETAKLLVEKQKGIEEASPTEYDKAFLKQKQDEENHALGITVADNQAASAR